MLKETIEKNNDKIKEKTLDDKKVKTKTLKAICFKGFRVLSNPFGLSNGTSGRTRTDTLLRATDFESVVSTNFTTLACMVKLIGL